MQKQILFTMVLVALLLSFIYIFFNLGVLLYQLIKDPSLAFSPDINFNLKPLEREFHDVKEQIEVVSHGIQNVNEAIVTKLQHLEDMLFTQFNKFGDATENIKTIKEELESLKRELFQLGGNVSQTVNEKKEQLSEKLGDWTSSYLSGDAQDSQNTEQAISHEQVEGKQRTIQSEPQEQEEVLPEVFDC